MRTSASGATQSSRVPSAHVWKKACDFCHRSKVRCAPSPLSPVGACKQCTQHCLRCVYTFPRPRRNPSRTRTRDERLTELEHRVQRLQKAVVQPLTEPSDTIDTLDRLDNHLRGSSKPRASNPSPIDTSYQPPPILPFPEYGDVVSRGLITAAKANELVLAFRIHLAGQLPGALLPRELFDSQLRRSRPIL